MYDELNVPTVVALFFLGIIIFAIPLMLVLSVFPSEFDTWAIEKDKLCWEKEGDFKISKYGVRCTKMNGEIIFNETFQPKEEPK